MIDAMPSRADSGKVRILVVEDNDDQRLLFQRYFERAGCAVTCAATAADAIALFDDTEPELALIDLVLPIMDGWELAHRLREYDPDCPIVVTSVLHSSRYPEVDAFLPKPVTNSGVRRVLSECVPRWIDV